MKEQECAALWTDGVITIVLPSVTTAYWAAEDDDEDEVRVPMAESDRFVVQCGDDGHNICDAIGDKPGAYRDRGVEFLRALSLYWETRV